MKRLLLALSLAAALAAQQPPPSTTTLSSAALAADPQVVLATVSGVAPGMILYVDREAMSVLSIVGSSANVLRGISSTGVAAHNAGATVYFGNGWNFLSSDPRGACLVPPGGLYVVIANGSTWSCASNLWTQQNGGGSGGASFPAATAANQVLKATGAGSNYTAGQVNFSELGGVPAVFSCPGSGAGIPFVNASGNTCRFALASDLPANAFASLSDASPINWNLSSAGVANGAVTLSHSTATRALNVSNLVNGGFYTLLLNQDSTGGAALTLGSGCTWKVGGAATAGTITLSSAALAIDVLAFTYDGTNCYANFLAAFK